MEAREAMAMAIWRAGAGQSWLEPLSCRPAGSSSGTRGNNKFRNGQTIVNNIGDIKHEWWGGVEWPGHNNPG